MLDNAKQSAEGHLVVPKRMEMISYVLIVAAFVALGTGVLQVHYLLSGIGVAILAVATALSYVALRRRRRAGAPPTDKLVPQAKQ